MAEQNNTSTFVFYIYLLHAVSQENEDICINSPSVHLEATTSEKARETLTVDMIPCIHQTLID
jgi:hypothetical protein